jgi:hypothetical protein
MNGHNFFFLGGGVPFSVDFFVHCKICQVFEGEQPRGKNLNGPFFGLSLLQGGPFPKLNLSSPVTNYITKFFLHSEVFFGL